MFSTFSTAFFGNSELIFMMIVSVIVTLSASWIYTFLPKENSRKTKQHSSLPAYCRPSRSFKKLTVHDAFWMIVLTIFYSIFSLWNLGSFNTIDSYWQPVSDHEEIIIQLNETKFDAILWVSGEGDNNSNPQGYQNQVDFRIQGSNDLSFWFDLCDLNTINYLKIQKISGDWNYRYIKVISRNSSNVLNEIGLKKTGADELITASVYSFTNTDSVYNPEKILDEQNFLVLNSSYENETYFDEIYHVRNAQEIKDGQHMYAYVHPLLGTQIIALGISAFGLSPFGWRIAGALFGIFMMPLIYLCSLHLFHKRRCAIFTCVLLGAEFMHYTTSRIGTLEPFSIFFILLMTFFMLKYAQTSFYDTSLRKQFSYLAWSGIFMGCACATKFTGVYGGIGLAILFFTNIFERFKEYLHAKKNIQASQIRRSDIRIVKLFWPSLIKTGIWCIIFFIIIPAGIYILSFVPIVMDKADSFSIKAVYDQTMSMYSYHKNLEASHPYQSVWWQWILDIRPIWYYVKYNESSMQTISAMGNPVIFWSGAAAMIWCFIDAFKNKSHRSLLISICYLAQLVPWLSVDRCVFIYHYYPSVPFLILAIVHASDSLLKKDRRFIKPIAVLTVLAVVLFIVFLPVIGGFETTRWYIDHMVRYMGSWYFG